MADNNKNRKRLVFSAGAVVVLLLVLFAVLGNPSWHPVVRNVQGYVYGVEGTCYEDLWFDKVKTTQAPDGAVIREIRRHNIRFPSVS